MTQFTSFVAVEEMVVNDGGTLRRIDVPVDVPEGVDRRLGLISGRMAGPGGSPTGLFTVHAASQAQNLGYIAQFNLGRRAAPSASPCSVTKSGGNVKASGTAQGSGSGGGTVPAPTNLSGFSLSAEARPSGTLTDPTPMTPEQQKLERLRSKLQPAILTLVYSMKRKGQPPIVNYGGFVRAGKAEVQLWLNDKSDLTKAKLKELGFELVIDHPNSNLMIGRLPIDKLELLPELDFVRYVSPQLSK